jgi:Zn finger protein HypA/HybF involved in hydrogenase expression
MSITRPDIFAEWFKSEVPGAYRAITSQDIRDMTDCGLIGKFKYYLHSDLEIVRAVLQYEQLWKKRIEEQKIEDKSEQLKCKRCGQPLPYRHEAKKGRRREYCQQCESSRAKERYRKWRKKDR